MCVDLKHCFRRFCAPAMFDRWVGYSLTEPISTPLMKNL